MAIIYDDNTSGAGYRRSNTPYDQLPATTFYLTHYKNWCYLRFLANHQDTGWQEKQQARHEMDVATRKMDYWRRHPNWDQARFEQGKQKVDAEWQTKPAPHVAPRSIHVDMPLGTTRAFDAGPQERNTQSPSSASQATSSLRKKS